MKSALQAVLQHSYALYAAKRAAQSYKFISYPIFLSLADRLYGLPSVQLALQSALWSGKALQQALQQNAFIRAFPGN